MPHEHNHSHEDHHGHDHTHAGHKGEHKHEKQYANIKVTKLPHSEVEIEGEILADELARTRKEAIKQLSADANIPGFRKGHIPESVLVSRLGEVAILEEAAEIALSHHYGHIVIDHNINVIGRPQITLTKVAPNNPLGFKIRVAVFPEVKMPAYKQIAKDVMKVEEKIEVTENEVDEVLKQIRREKAKKDGIKIEDAAPTGDKSVDEKNMKEADKNLPELTDEYILSLGTDMRTVVDIRKRAHEHIMQDKKMKAQDKKRLQIGEKLVADSEMDLPEILVESELNKMKHQFESDLSRMGLDLKGYLGHIKKTEDDMKKDWRKDAESRVKLQIILNRIGADEKLFPTEDEIERESKHLLEHHKDADPEQVRNYVETMMMNEKVFRFLEGNSEADNSEEKLKKSSDSDITEKKESKKKK